MFFFIFIPHSLCSCKRMVSITNSKKKNRPVFRCICRSKLFQCATNIFHIRLSFYSPARNASGILHHVSRIQRFARLNSFPSSFNKRMFRVIHQKHNMRQFQRSTTADFHSWRNTLNNSCFRSTNQSLAERFPLVSFQINGTNKPMTHTTISSFSLNINEFLFSSTKNTAVKIFFHSPADFFNTLRFILVIKINFRQNNIQSARFIRSSFLNIFPIFSILSVLVTGNNRPAFHIKIFRQ